MKKIKFMKLVTLNIWGGRVKEKHGEFFDRYKDVDIWCFQEVHNKGIQQIHVPGLNIDTELFSNLSNTFSNYVGEFCQSYNGYYGLATFFNNKLELFQNGETFIARGLDLEKDHKDWDHHRKLQWLELKEGGKLFLLVNLHGTHRPEGKSDSEKRLNQSRMIVNFLNMFNCPKILVGDFNLLPETKSIEMLEESGMRNLIKEYGITSTRTELYKKPIQFADYIFVSPEIKVNDFRVLPDVVSDHSPLFLDFDII